MLRAAGGWRAPGRASRWRGWRRSAGRPPAPPCRSPGGLRLEIHLASVQRGLVDTGAGPVVGVGAELPHLVLEDELGADLGLRHARAPYHRLRVCLEVYSNADAIVTFWRRRPLY